MSSTFQTRKKMEKQNKSKKKKINKTIHIFMLSSRAFQKKKKLFIKLDVTDDDGRVQFHEDIDIRSIRCEGFVFIFL